jgi:hypothetical protein
VEIIDNEGFAQRNWLMKRGTHLIFDPLEWLNTPVTFTIALKQRNLDVLEKLFWRISDPTDSMYGKHMTLKVISKVSIFSL